MARTKADLINGAYNQLRIRGITLEPSSADSTLALDRMENMANEFASRGICLGYNFEDSPNTATNHNIPRKYWYAVETNLAVRLLPDFGKPAPPELFAAANAGLSFLYSSSVEVDGVDYPTRMPIGSGNSRWSRRLNRFYTPVDHAPIECATNQMYVDDVQDFTESFIDMLDQVAGETIASFTIEADDGLTISSSSLASPVISYRIQADGETGEENAAPYRVKIVATTSTGRIQTRIINFELTEVEL